MRAARFRRELLPFARRLRALRRGRNLSQQSLAEEIGINNATVSDYEIAVACPSAEILRKLADAFRVTMDELWRGTGRCEGLGESAPISTRGET